MTTPVVCTSAASPRRVAIAGATGLVGQHLLLQLLADDSVSEIHLLSRRMVTIGDSKIRQHRVDFAQLPALPAIDELYLALGTTLRHAGSEEAFRAVDYDANLATAKAALAAGAQRIALVSAAGADARSRLFYNRTKGELEDAIRALDVPSLLIARPTLLLGDRASLGQSSRPLEYWSQRLLAPLGALLPASWRPVTAEAVARALTQTLPTRQGIHTLSSTQIQSFNRNPRHVER